MNQLRAALAFLAFYPSLVFAQNSAVLERYVAEAMANSTAVRAADFEVKKAALETRLAEAKRRFSVTAEANYTLAAGGRKIDFPIGDLLNPAYSALNQLTQSQNFPTLENQAINFLPNNFQETKASFAYPIFNPAARFNVDLKKSLERTAEKGRATAVFALRHDLTEAYLNYLQSLEAERILTKSQTVLAEFKRLNEALVKNNVATREVVFAADFELSKLENQLFRLKNDQKTARAFFNHLAGKPLDSAVEADTFWLRKPAEKFEKAVLEEAVFSKRPELEQLRSGLETTALAADFFEKKNRLPTAYFGGETGFQGFGYRVWDDQIFALARVGVQYDLLDGGAKKRQSELAKIESEALKNRLDDAQRGIKMQLEKALNEHESALFSLKSAEKGILAAESAFKIVDSKYRNQQALFIEFLDAQNRVTVAREQLLQAQIEVLKKAESLKRAAGF